MKRYGGLSAAMYVEVAKRGAAKGYKWGELSWTREDDAPINLGIRAMGAKIYKKYRVYTKALRPEREGPLEGDHGALYRAKPLRLGFCQAILPARGHERRPTSPTCRSPSATSSRASTASTTCSASGGMGIVVAATHLQLEQKVALKFLLPSAIQSAEAVERFLREARAAVRLKSEHVAKVTDVGTLENGAPYMVMEFLDGADLSRVDQADGHVAGRRGRQLRPASVRGDRRGALAGHRAPRSQAAEPVRHAQGRRAARSSRCSTSASRSPSTRSRGSR